MSRIRLSIDQLTLRGFEPAERTAIIDGLKTELARVLADPAARAAWKSRRTPVLRLGKLPFQPGPSGSRNFGGSVARAIGKSVKP
jgi:hypothetical protein